MAGVHPLGDLAPRDVVSAAMTAVLLRDGVDHLFLDGTHLGAAGWQRHFPTILGLCRERGIDPVVDPIPVRPAAHYHCGGVAADLDGRTSVPGLYAVGEVAATGVHGANRLASNSLTEALVAGDRVGVELSRGLAPRRDPEPPPDLPTGAVPDLGEQMSDDAGVLRTGERLSGLLDRLDTATGPPHLAPAATTADAGATGTADGRAAGIDAANRLLVARAVVTAALHRTESRGCHRRADHPATDPAQQHHLAWALQHGRLVATGPAPADGHLGEPAPSTQEVA